MNKNIIKKISAQLEPIYHDAAHQEQVAWWMVCAITGKTQAALLVASTVLNEEQNRVLEEWLHKHVALKMPLQYLIGSVPFIDCTIVVEPPILIPRPETEEWVSNLITQLRPLKNKKIMILDLCTGSGAIACALAQAIPEATVVATDISHDALALVQKNAEKNNVSIECIQSDLFESLVGKKFDLIVANPPYISHEEWVNLDATVRDWEDYKALVARDNGLQLLYTIIEQAPDYLQKNSEFEHYAIPQLVTEIGYNQGDSVVTYMKNYFDKVRLIQDGNGVDRLVTGTL